MKINALQQIRQHVQMMLVCLGAIFLLTHAHRLEHVDHVLHFGINLVLVLLVAELLRILKFVC
jgi:hypothetical protein